MGDEYIEVNKGSAYFEFEKGENIQITYEEILQGFELGFKNIQDIYEAKRLNGSLSAILEKIKL